MSNVALVIDVGLLIWRINQFFCGEIVCFKIAS
jgi:hypothetical protein